jgi:pSer/pThr/pTyr-binding forkhead associated (FHA) protein
MEVQLLVLEGAHQGLRITLPPTQFVIGRDPECHLRPASSDVSRFHCAIARLGQQVLVRDLNSRNGTFLNEERVTGTVKVNEGDTLKIGPLRLQFHVNLGPGSMTVRESSLSWLVRSPNDQENQALDPEHETAILGFYTEPGEAASRPPARDSEQQPRLGSAVAGDFLREYLNRRKGRTDPP